MDVPKAVKGKAGRLMYETLRNYGVTHLFGLDDPCDLYMALDKKVIKPITARNEKHAAIMAHGYAKVTKSPVCVRQSAPGATNLITGLAEAFKSSTPVIALVQDFNRANRGRNTSMEIDHEPLFRAVVKSVERFEDPNRIPEMVRKVFRIATSGRPGPVALLCPADTGRRGEAEVMPNRVVISTLLGDHVRARAPLGKPWSYWRRPRTR
jgi:acetolactate synthase-1/2/3 large subunit